MVEIFAIDEGGDSGKEVTAEFIIARNRPCPEKRRLFPQLPPGLVIIFVPSQREREAAALALWPEPEIDTVGKTVFGIRGHESSQFLCQFDVILEGRHPVHRNPGNRRYS